MKVIEIIEGSQPQSDDDKAKRLKNALARAKKYKTTQGSMMGTHYDKQTRGWAQGGKTGGRWMVDPDAAGKTPVITEPTNLKPRTGSNI